MKIIILHHAGHGGKIAFAASNIARLEPVSSDSADRGTSIYTTERDYTDRNRHTVKESFDKVLRMLEGKDADKWEKRCFYLSSCFGYGDWNDIAGIRSDDRASDEVVYAAIDKLIAEAP